MTTHADSSDILTGGAWVVVRGVARWVAEPVVEERPVLTVRPKKQGVVCSTCNATTGDWCRAASGKPRLDHAERISMRTCACGDAVVGKSRYCPPCKVEARAATFRARDERKRAEAAELEIAA